MSQEEIDLQGTRILVVVVVPLLAQHFLQVFAVEMGLDTPLLTPEAARVLTGHRYPGNIRELKNMERALEKTYGNIAAAARLMGVDRTKIYRKLKQAGKLPPRASV